MSSLVEVKKGKVRDIYEQDGDLLLKATDRHSSFDRVIAEVPEKGKVLTQMSLWWFDKTSDIVQNHVISSPELDTILAKKCTPLPVEVIVRGYITGSTRTSLWTAYNNGQRDFGSEEGGFSLPDGLKKNQKLDKPVITPTTKSDFGDENITSQKIVDQGFVDEKIWRQVEDVAIKLFERGQELAQEKGWILVDTKYEFGLDVDGNLTLIDEIHTPDSSRYWHADSYEKRFARGEDPKAFDKDFLRNWFKQNCDPYKDEVLPTAPWEMVQELSERYIQIFEEITGLRFVKADDSV